MVDGPDGVDGVHDSPRRVEGVQSPLRETRSCPALSRYYCLIAGSLSQNAQMNGHGTPTSEPWFASVTSGALPSLFIGLVLVALAPIVYRFDPWFRGFVARFWGFKAPSEESRQLWGAISAVVVGGIGLVAVAGGVYGIAVGHRLW